MSSIDYLDVDENIIPINQKLLALAVIKPVKSSVELKMVEA